MSKEIIHIINVPDVKDVKGNWIKSYTSSSDTAQIISHTRGSVLWKSVVARTNKDGTHRKSRPTYENCRNLFETYNTFVDWCNMQYGYMHKEDSGRYWSLDKDLLVPGNKDYSPETCLFMPNKVNSIFSGKKKDNGLPLGVSKLQHDRPGFKYKCGSGSTEIWGKHPTPQGAHMGWQAAKIAELETLLKEDVLGKQIHELLSSRLTTLRYEFENKIETIWRV